MFRRLESESFKTLKAEIESHPRLCGYYLIRLIGLTPSTESSATDEQKLDAILQRFDDQAWPPAARRPANQAWSDYAVSVDAARAHAIASLMGGHGIGHKRPTIPPELAEAFWNRFDAEFEHPKIYYTGLGLGSDEYVFRNGVAIVSPTRAGVLGIVEND